MQAPMLSLRWLLSDVSELSTCSSQVDDQKREEANPEEMFIVRDEFHDSEGLCFAG